jgi:hypothetical protein
MKIFGNITEISSLIFRNRTSPFKQVTLTVGTDAPTADIEIKLPDDESVIPVASSDTLVGKAAKQTLLNKTLTSPTISGGTVSETTISGATITGGTISGLTSPLAVASGGTGLNSLTLNGILFGNAGSTLNVTTAGTQYQVLSAGVGGVPAFGALSLDQVSAVTGILPVANGGTNASTGATARSNLGAAASGANSDIISLTGLTTALSVAQGGTGVTSSTGTGAGVHASGPTLTTPQINSALLIQEIATPANPSAGFDKLYTKSDGILYKLNSSGNEVPVGSGTGSGEINAVLNPSAATNTTGWTAATNYTVAKDTGNSPLSPVTGTSFSLTTTALSSESSTSGIYYSIGTMPSGLLNKKLKVEFYVTSPASSAGTWKVSVYAGSTRLSLTTDVSGSTTVPAGFTGKFVAYFDATNATAYSVNFTQTARTSANTMYVTNVIVGPGIQPQGAVVGEWQSYTPTLTNLGTATFTTSTWKYRRVGTDIEISGYFLVNAAGSGAGNITIPLPLGTTINTSVISQGSGADRGVHGYGQWKVSGSGYNLAAPIYLNTSAFEVFAEDGSGVGNVITGANLLATNELWLTVRLPIAEWAGSGTVQLAQNDVEYAWNSTATITTDQTDSNYGYGPSGVNIRAFAPGALSSVLKRVQFQSPIQSTDKIVIETSSDGIVWGNNAYPVSFNDAGTAAYGLSYRIVSSTKLDIDFAGAAYPSVTWGSLTGIRWRVRKSSAGAAVGFGIVQPGVSSGLVSAAGLPGNTTGNVVAAGYVGETNPNSQGILRSGTNGSTYSTRSSTTVPLATEGKVIAITLNKGTYLISGSVSCQLLSGAGQLAGRVYIGGTSTGGYVYNPINAASNGSISFCLPVNITADGVEISVYAFATSAAGASNSHEMFAVRLA